MNQLHSYPSVYQIGHKAIQDIFKSPVLIEEKCDGSQFSWGLLDGELVCRSKGKQLLLDAPEKMFTKAVEAVRNMHLTPNWVYRGEFLSTPKHNTLAYSRIPVNHLILFDINTGLEEYMTWEAKAEEAHRLGIEVVPMMYQGVVENFDMFQSFIERESVLGGCKVEGVVVKNYTLFTQEKKVAMGKYVSEAFKEVHQKDWKQRNPTGRDFIETLIAEYATDARFQKAVQHLRESGLLEGSAKDIGLLIKEVPADILKECEQDIKEKLFKHFWSQISRGITRTVPEWYKQELARGSFNEE